MDRASLIGLVLGVAAVLGGHWLEGGQLALFVQPGALAIVGLGTLAAVLLHHPWPVFRRGLAMGWQALRPLPSEAEVLIRRVAAWAHLARSDGMLALEKPLALTRDPLQRAGLQLLIDGASPEALRAALDVRITAFETAERQAARIWEAAGGYAPTFGILGAVLGLIHVMENLADPTRLGAGIAVAFVATLYGVGFANLVLLPIANKLKFGIAQRVAEREIVADGLVALASGEHPRMIEARLRGYL